MNILEAFTELDKVLQESASTTDETQSEDKNQASSFNKTANISEEDRLELEKLVKKANEHTTATPKYPVTLYNGRYYLSLESAESTYEIDEIDYDGNDDPYININKYVKYLEESVLEDGYIFDVAYGLGISEEVIESLSPKDKGSLIDIPGSSWKLLFDFDLDYNEPSITYYDSRPATYWDPGYTEVEHEDLNWSVTCYLVKEA